MNLALEIIQAIKDGLKKFGEYNYYDKGPSEVMFMEKWTKQLRALGAEEAAKVLLVVLQYEHGEPFARHIVVDWDTRDDFDTLLDQNQRLSNLY